MNRSNVGVEFDPRVGVVLPVYNHSGLVVEALVSLERQREAPSCAVAFVNDGCRFLETDLVGSVFRSTEAALHCHNLRRRNGGLSAARNTGVEFLLSRYPRIEAIYMLDADNRLEPYALAGLASTLAEHPDAGWFYPDIEMFGLRLSATYGGDYSSLLHLFTNISEAGSLIRRAVFDAGVRFDETMRQGYEDWEFWLAAQAAGFRGRHLPDCGFRYRKRPESMLAESTRDDAEIKSYIRRKHRRLYSPKAMIALEAAEAPRYAVILDGDRVLVGSDPAKPQRILSVAEYAKDVWSWMLRPDENFTPPFLVSISSEALETLIRCKLLAWTLWDLESRLRESNISNLDLGLFASTGVAATPDRKNTLNATAEGHMAMTTLQLVREVLKDESLSWWDALLSATAPITISERTVLVDDEGASFAPLQSLRYLHDVVARVFHSSFRGALALDWRWAAAGHDDRQTLYKSIRTAVSQGVVLTRPLDQARHVAMICSFADFGGVEKVAFNVAAALKACGFVMHFVLFRTGEIHLPEAFRDTFASFSWITAEGMLRWDGSEFDGTRLSWWSQFGDKRNATGLLASFDAVINCQSADAHGVMGDLKRLGVVTLTHQHIVEHSPAGLPGGSAVLAKAFEHSYDHLLTGSAQLLDWFIANGVPQAKLTHIHNAPSYALPTAELEAMWDDRLKRSEAAPLRVLFAARFDAQKGVDRLLALHRLAAKGGLELDWRVVGKAIVDGVGASSTLEMVARIEPPVYTTEELTRLYAWADVIVMPSRYEGVPLTAIEGMRCGAIILAADAGAISEVVENGIDGVVVPQAKCVEAMYAALDRLSKDRDELRRLSNAAMQRAAAWSWCGSVASTARRLHAAIEAKQRVRDSDSAGKTRSLSPHLVGHHDTQDRTLDAIDGRRGMTLLETSHPGY